MTQPRRHAFTLPELIVVIGIIAMLAAIILPFFDKTISVQRRIACADHLEKIGQACAIRGASRMSDSSGRGVAATNWQNELSLYLSFDKSVFICPEDDEPSPDPGGGLKGICIEVLSGNTLWWDVYLDQADSDQWIWKMSRTQYEAFSAVSGEGVTTPYKAVYERTGYVPDNDPYTMYFTFEDTAPGGGGDQDFYDAVLEAHYTLTEIKFRVMVRASGLRFSLCKKDPDRTVLIPDLTVGSVATTPAYGGKCSYGMNSVSEDILLGKDKLLVLDYERVIAVGSNLEEEGTNHGEHLGYWDGDPNDPKAPPTFARHFGKVNVLFANGTVRLMSLDEINPNDPENARKHWDP